MSLEKKIAKFAMSDGLWKFFGFIGRIFWRIADLRKTGLGRLIGTFGTLAILVAIACALVSLLGIEIKITSTSLPESLSNGAFFYYLFAIAIWKSATFWNKPKPKVNFILEVGDASLN